MEDVYRFGLLTLYAANEALVAADPRGPERARGEQHTILDLPALFADLAFRTALLARVDDPVIRAWWEDYFNPLDRRVQLEIVNPVLTKINRYAGSAAARGVVGQPRSTIDPLGWVREGRIVIVDGASGAVGEDTAALVCGALVNLLKLAVAAQIARDPAERRPVTLIVDEFHAVPGADYEAILSELGKFGANLVLATQSLDRLDTLDRGGARALRATVFANNDGLFAFNVSASDARYLLPELDDDGELAIADLTALEDYQCYARISFGRRRLPTFLLALAAPPAADAGTAGALAALAASRYGRDRALVEAERASARARVALARGGAWANAGAGSGGATRAPGGAEAPALAAPDGGRKARQGRRARHNEARRDGQRSLWDLHGGEVQEGGS